MFLSGVIGIKGSTERRERKGIARCATSVGSWLGVVHRKKGMSTSMGQAVDLLNYLKLCRSCPHRQDRVRRMRSG